MAHIADSPVVAARLADRIRDPARERPIVCVTVPSWASEPLVDVEALAGELAEAAELWVISTNDASWELSDRLPDGLDVYGGAVRVWWPGLDDDADRYDHPLFLVYGPAESAKVIEQVVEVIDRWQQHAGARPEPGQEYGATVTRLLGSGAELRLVDGTLAFAHRSHLSHHDLPPERVLRVGQAVRVRVSEPEPSRRRVPVSLLPFEPDGWQRISEDYRVGELIEVVVAELRNVGAFVRLLPDVRGLVHKSQLSHEWVGHPEDILSKGECVIARITGLDPEQHRVELAIRGVSGDADAPAAAIYPDGPPWLPPMPRPTRFEQPGSGIEAVAGRIGGRDSSTGSESADPYGRLAAADPVAAHRSTATPEPAAVDQVGVGQQLQPAQPGQPGSTMDLDLTLVVEDESPPPADEEWEQLEQTIQDARQAQQDVQHLLQSRHRQLSLLRAEAAQVRRTLERDLGEVRQRILELLESESQQLIGSTQQALEEARREAAQLREQLAAADQQRRHLLTRLREASRRAEHAEAGVRQAREQLRSERADGQALRTQLERLVPNEAKRLRDEIRAAWEHSTTVDDKASYPWREPRIGADFAESLRRVAGVSRGRVMEVCAEVVCGRAPDRPGFELHPLRTSEAGGSPQRVRTDGAKAYRVSLQVHTPAARRLHYWLLPGGGVELAKVVYHDDFTI